MCVFVCVCVFFPQLFFVNLGAMAVDAMVHRDGPVIFGTVLFAAVVMVFASLILDGVAMLLDPRLRRGTT